MGRNDNNTAGSGQSGSDAAAASQAAFNDLYSSALYARLFQQQQQQQQQQPPKQSGYLKVQVPPGTAPGTTLHVQIPNGGGKMVAAQVPPNCSEFHVQYTL
mmetsp:Transcript_2567/g.6973  ORF Transcript_2567/g.6973 Transcript_2567/m.6973 type:complete len:101 (-) Transcript_2567:108-410(-)